MDTRNNIADSIDQQFSQLDELIKVATSYNSNLSNIHWIMVGDKHDEKGNLVKLTITQLRILHALSAFLEKFSSFHLWLSTLPSETRTIDTVATALERLNHAKENPSFPLNTDELTVDNFYLLSTCVVRLIEAKRSNNEWVNLLAIQIMQLEDCMKHAIQCDQDAFVLQRNMSHLVDSTKKERDKNAKEYSVAQAKYFDALTAYHEKFLALHSTITELPLSITSTVEIKPVVEQLEMAHKNKIVPKSKDEYSIDNYDAYARYMIGFIEQQNMLTIKSYQSLLCDFKVEMFVLKVLHKKNRLINLKKSNQEDSSHEVNSLFSEYLGLFRSIEGDIEQFKKKQMIDDGAFKRLTSISDRCKDPFYSYAQAQIPETTESKRSTLKKVFSKRSKSSEANFASNDGTSFLKKEYVDVSRLFYLAQYFKLKPRILTAIDEVVVSSAQTKSEENLNTYNEISTTLSIMSTELADLDSEFNLTEDEFRLLIEDNKESLFAFFKDHYQQAFEDHILECYLANEQRLAAFNETYIQPSNKLIEYHTMFGRNASLSRNEAIRKIHHDAYREASKKDVKADLSSGHLRAEFQNFVKTKLYEGFSKKVDLKGDYTLLSDISSSDSDDPTTYNTPLYSPRQGDLPEEVIDELRDVLNEPENLGATRSTSSKRKKPRQPTTTQSERTLKKWGVLMNMNSPRGSREEATAPVVPLTQPNEFKEDSPSTPDHLANTDNKSVDLKVITPEIRPAQFEDVTARWVTLARPQIQVAKAVLLPNGLQDDSSATNPMTIFTPPSSQASSKRRRRIRPAAAPASPNNDIKELEDAWKRMHIKKL